MSNTSAAHTGPRNLEIVRDGFDQTIPPGSTLDVPDADAADEIWLKFARANGRAVDASRFTANEWEKFVKACRQVANEGKAPVLPSANIGKPVRDYRPEDFAHAPTARAIPPKIDELLARRADILAGERQFHFRRGLAIGFCLGIAGLAFAEVVFLTVRGAF